MSRSLRRTLIRITLPYLPTQHMQHICIACRPTKYKPIQALADCGMTVPRLFQHRQAAVHHQANCNQVAQQHSARMVVLLKQPGALCLGCSLAQVSCDLLEMKLLMFGRLTAVL